MAEQIYIYVAPATINCDSCRQLAAGDQVDIFLRQDLLPALPESIRGIVQLVDDLEYTIQYDDEDLNGVIPVLTDEFVDRVECVSCCILAQEYSDGNDAIQDARIDAIEVALANLGVIPSDGDSRFVVHPDSEEGVSVESIKHDKVVVAKDGGSDAIILDPVDLISPLAISVVTGLAYRLEIYVSVIATEKPINDRDSVSEFLVVGEFDKGLSLQTVSQQLRDGANITANLIGNNTHINLNNPSSGDLTMFVTSKIRVLS